MFFQKRAYEEIRSVFDDDKNRNIAHRDLQDLPYLEMVIKEVMRLYPPAPHFSREIEEDVEYGNHITNSYNKTTVDNLKLIQEFHKFANTIHFNFSFSSIKISLKTNNFRLCNII